MGGRLILCSALLLRAEAETVEWSPRPPIYEHLGQKSLYPPDGTVDLLSGSHCDLSKRSLGRTWLVEFYHSSCPHCWYFAPVFRQLGAAYRGSESVHVAACNCMEKENQKACDAMQIYRYPTVQVFQAGEEGAKKLFEVSHTDKDGRTKSAAQLLAWLEEHKLPKPLHPEATEQGADFAAATALAPGAPPGRPGWSWEYHAEDERWAEAHLGLIALLKSYNGRQPPASLLRVASFVAQNCLHGCDRYHLLVERLHSADLRDATTVREEVERWGQLFGRRKHLFCKDETCAVWQLFHVMAGSVAAAQFGLRVNSGGATVAEAMDFFRQTVDHFLFCGPCREHFLNAYEGCSYGRCEVLASKQDQAKRLVLWLWRLHNGVSLRVLREHPPKEAVDRRWPTYRDCPGCWNPRVVTGEVIEEENLDSAFDLERVYGFLLSSYVGEENVEKHLAMESKVLMDADAERNPIAQAAQPWFVGPSMLAMLGAASFALFTLARRHSHSNQRCGVTSDPESSEAWE